MLGVPSRPLGLEIDLEGLGVGPDGTGASGAGGADGSAGAGSAKEAASCALSPAEAYVAACVLGDLLPPEWPPQQVPGAAAAASAGAAGKGGAGGGGGGDSGAVDAPPPPPLPLRRAALLPQLVEAESALRRLLSFAAGCESRLVRCAVVRLSAKAAGLGPAMGTFCAQPLVEPLTVGGWAGV